MDCSCNRDPTKCMATIHLCLCQQTSTYFDRTLEVFREYTPPRGFIHCKAEYHHCRCSESGGTYECRRKTDHICVCSVRGEYGQKNCIADKAKHNCVCKMYSPDSCLSENHICMCAQGNSKCLSIIHECSCLKVTNTCKCQAPDLSHNCTCDFSVKNCLAKVHKCRCNNTASNPEKCRSENHPCFCMSNVGCQNEPHVCVCSKNPGRCKHHTHLCVCNKFIGHCLVHVGKVY